MKTEPKFTIEDGLKYQQVDLLQWKSILKTKVYNELERRVLEENKKLEYSINSGYDVCRGSSIQNIVLNLINF